MEHVNTALYGAAAVVSMGGVTILDETTAHMIKYIAYKLGTSHVNNICDWLCNHPPCLCYLTQLCKNSCSKILIFNQVLVKSQDTNMKASTATPMV